MESPAHSAADFPHGDGECGNETDKPAGQSQTWKWKRKRAGQRRQEIVTVSYNVAGWPKDTSGALQHCHTVLDRKRAGRPLCTEPVVWQVERKVPGEAIVSGSYYCDTDLPDEDRPEETS